MPSKRLKGRSQQYPRGFTATEGHPSDRPAPKLTATSYNDLSPRARSIFMSPPTGDTQEPRGSGIRKRLNKGKRR